MTIYLIRHGLTEANLRHLYCGSTDLPLSPAGREALAEKNITPPEGARFIHSGMLRCRETMDILFPNAESEAVPGFREIDFGAFEMKSYEELKDDPEYIAWITGDNDANVPPQGESGNGMTARALAAFYEVRGAGSNAVIITHGGVIAALMEALFPGSGKNRYQWQPKPGCGYCLSFQSGDMTYSEI